MFFWQWDKNCKQIRTCVGYYTEGWDFILFRCEYMNKQDRKKDFHHRITRKWQKALKHEYSILFQMLSIR